MTVDPGQLLPVALDAIAIASELVRTRGPGRVTIKGDRDMASEVDYAVEHAVRSFLHEKTPDIAFLGEEEGTTGRGTNDLTWALDPVDGTANFVHGIPLCGISLGLISGDRSILGMIDLPFLGSRYHATENGGAYAGDRRLLVSDTVALADAIVSIGDYAVGPNAESRNRLRLAVTTHLAPQAQRVRMFGSAAVDLAWLAEGRTDAVIMLSNKPWDTTAGVLLAREAGAQVVDIDGSPHTVDSTATIAAPPQLIDQVVTLVRQSRSDTP